MLEHSQVFDSNSDWSFSNLANKNAIVAKYGIPCLDKYIKGIMKSDLILIGAPTGCGKSTLATLMAKANSKIGKKVMVISLENFAGDHCYEKTFYSYKALSGDYSIDIMDFQKRYQENKLDKKILMEAEKEAKASFENVSYIYRNNENYTIEQLKTDIEYTFKETMVDLIIIDHIDYLDKECSENDIEHITKLMTAIRGFQVTCNMPVVCISHIRKNAVSLKNPSIIPSLDDFIGSSNKTKVATVVITLAPDTMDEARNKTVKPYEKPTFCCVRKHRKLGRKVVGFAYRMIFDDRFGSYSEIGITRFKTNYSGTVVECEDSENIGASKWSA